MTDALAPDSAPLSEGAPIDTGQTTLPQALGSQVPQEKPSLDAALDKALAKVEAKRAEVKEPKVEAKPEAKVEPKEAKAEPKVEAKPEVKAEPRGETKTEAPETRPDAPYREPPSRFSPDAKTAWETAPDPVKAEVHRAIKELEQGHQKYKADAEAYSEVREYAELAKKHGTTVKQALDNYIGIERKLQQDPVAGLEQIVANLNLKAPDGRPLSLHDVAAHILNQSPDEQASRQSSTIQQLNAKIAQLEQMVGGVTQSIQQQQATATNAEVAAFAKDHPRFEELSEDIAFFLQSDKVPAHLTPRERLSEAYKLAERLNPASVASAPATAVTPPAPLNPAGQKSITGSPATGSNPAPRKGPAPSLDDAIERAFARTG